MSSPTTSEMVTDLRQPSVTMVEAEEMIVELIDARRIAGAERWKVARELDGIVKEMPARLLPALDMAKDRTLLTASTFAPVAFPISATRQQVVQHLVKHGISNPTLAREVLHEYVGRKERVVRGWPGGVRAGIEVIQGGLRDIGIELGTLPVNHLVERVQLETGHISLSQLMRFLKSFPAPSSPAMVRVHEEKALPEAERAVRRWVQMCFKGGASRFEVGVELEEIKRQIGLHLHPIFPVVLRMNHLPAFPCHPHAHGLASADRLILPAIQTDADPEFIFELFMERVGWAERRTIGAWGRRERAEMGGKLVEYERLLAGTASTAHLATVVQRVRFETRCPPFESVVSSGPSQSDLGTQSASHHSDPHQIELALRTTPRTMDDGQIGALLQAYIDGERAKASESVLDVGGWGEVDKKRVSHTLQTMRERLNDPSLDLIFGAMILQLLPTPVGGTFTPVLTRPTSEQSHATREPAPTPILTTALKPTGSPNSRGSARSSPSGPSPTIPLPPLPVPLPVSPRRQTTEVTPSPVSRPSFERRQLSEQYTSSTASSVTRPSTLKTTHSELVSPIVAGTSEDDPAIVENAAPGQAKPERPVKSSRRFSLFGGSKTKGDVVDKAKDKKETPVSPPKKDKHAPPAVPKSTSVPKSKILTKADLELKRNTEANRTIELAPALVSPTVTISPPVRSATEPGPMIKSVSSLSFADSIASAASASTSGSSVSVLSKDALVVKPEKKRNLLLKKQPSTGSAQGGGSISMIDLSQATHHAGSHETDSSFDIHPTLPAALSSTGDLHGRLEKANIVDEGVATPRPRKASTERDGRRKSMIDQPSTDGDTKSRRFSLFGSGRKSSKTERYPALPPSPGVLEETFVPRRLSMSRSSSQVSLFDEERPASRVLLNERDFPDFAQLRAPHLMNSPPKIAGPNLAPLPVSASPSTSPRQAWRAPAASFSRASRGMSTPPIMEGDGEQALQDAPSGRLLGGTRSALCHVAESDPGHGGLLIDEAPRLPTSAITRVYSLADNAVRRDFDLTRKIDPPAPSPPPPAPQELHDQLQKYAINSDPSTPPLSPRQQTSAKLGSEPNPVVGPISPAATPAKTSPVTESTAVPDAKSRPDSTMSFGADAGPALSMLFSNSSAAPSPVRATFSNPSSPPAPKRSLPPPPPSPTTSAGPSSSSAHDHQEHVPPILTVRAVFAALSPTEQHSTGKVLDILIGFIDRQREQSIMVDRKKGWGEAERTKAGFIISEVEAELLPTNPHLAQVLERVRVLTDCPPQIKSRKRSSKRLAPSAPRPILTSNGSSSSLSSASSMSSATTSASTASDVSSLSASSFATDSSLRTDISTESALSRTSSDSDDTVIFQTSPTSNQAQDSPGLDRSSSTRTITRASPSIMRDASPAATPTSSPRTTRSFVPSSSFDSISPSTVTHTRSGSGSIPPVSASAPARASHGAPVRSSTVSGPRSPSQPSGPNVRRTSSEAAGPPPPYERARRSSSLREGHPV